VTRLVRPLSINPRVEYDTPPISDGMDENEKPAKDTEERVPLTNRSINPE